MKLPAFPFNPEAPAYPRSPVSPVNQILTHYHCGATQAQVQKFVHPKGVGACWALDDFIYYNIKRNTQVRRLTCK